jgi:glycosyltransferase involved in cell wall biosynthesis
MNRLLIVTTIGATLRGFILPFAYHFRDRGWRVDGMAKGVSTCPECLQAFDRVWEVEWSRNPLQLQNLMVAPQQIREVVEQEGYDIVHVHTPVAAFVTRYALNGLRKKGKPKVIYTAHGFHFHRQGKSLKNAIFLALEKLAGQWTDYLVMINREDEEAAKRYRIVPHERIRYMPGIGVDFKYYNPDAITESEVGRVYQELGLAAEAPLFLSVAELIPRKRHRDLLQAFAQLGYPDVHLALAGDGRLLEQMQQFAIELGIQKQIHFLGFRRDIPTLIRAADAVILASEQEGLPRCIMEAFCLETPVIGTRIRGSQDLLEGGCGLLVEVGDVEGLAQAMNWILEHPVEAQLIARKAKERIAAYELGHIMELHETLYAEALQEIG